MAPACVASTLASKRSNARTAASRTPASAFLSRATMAPTCAVSRLAFKRSNARIAASRTQASESEQVARAGRVGGDDRASGDESAGSSRQRRTTGFTSASGSTRQGGTGASVRRAMMAPACAA
eukprot:4726017-Prymnesium_polylepis.1